MSIILRSGTSGALAEVTAAGELMTTARVTEAPAGGMPIRSGRFDAVSMEFPPGNTGVVGPVNIEAAGNVTFVVKNTVPDAPYGGTPALTFEQSDDGVTWAALPVMRTDNNVVRADRILDPGVAGVQKMFDAEVEGATFVRVRVLTAATTNSMTIVVQPGAMPFTPAVAVVEPTRNTVIVSGTRRAVGSSGTETAVTLTRVRGKEVPLSDTSFAVTTGRTFRMISMLLSQVGNATQSAAETIFRLRMNPAGKVTTSSPVMLECRLATEAVPGAYEQIVLPIPTGIEFWGDGLTNFGVTVNSTYTGNSAPTVDVMFLGYEY